MPEPEYRFKHVLIQEAAYRTLVADRRGALHGRAAAWLEERYAGREDEVAGLLAHHWLAAEDEDKAVANASKHGVPFAEAITVFGDPVALIVDDPGRPENARIVGVSLAQRVLLVVFVERDGDVVRVISARRATRHERRRYEEGQ